MTEEKLDTINVDEITYREISDPKVMAKEPLVSVQMSTYNHEPYISQAIEGVLMQEINFRIELVIGEDCSMDRTREIVLAYQRKRPDIIRVVAWDKNTGCRRNSRKVNELLRGKYFAFCNGDDCWTHPKKLQMQVDIMEADPEVGLVHGGVDVFREITEKKTKWKYMKDRTNKNFDLFTNILMGLYPQIYTSTVCMRTAVYRSIRKNNPDSWAEEFIMGDTQTWLEASRVCKFRLIEKSLGQYNILAESVWNTQSIHKMTQNVISAYKMWLHFVKKYHCSDFIERDIHKRFNNMLLDFAFESNDVVLANSVVNELTKIGERLNIKQNMMLIGLRRSNIKPIINIFINPRHMLGRVLYTILPRSYYIRLRNLVYLKFLVL